MSLRDWLAGQALAGMLAAGSYNEMAIWATAEDAYRYADAMLEASQMTDPDDDLGRSSRLPPGWWVPFLLCVALGMGAAEALKIVLGAV